VTVPIAPGELIDKITIPEIKSERIADAGKLANLRGDPAALCAARDRSIFDGDGPAVLFAEAKRYSCCASSGIM
jgi:hypothetical protein